MSAVYVVWVRRAVANSIDIRIAGNAATVDNDAVVSGQPGRCRQFDIGDDTRADKYHICLYLLVTIDFDSGNSNVWANSNTIFNTTGDGLNFDSSNSNVDIKHNRLEDINGSRGIAMGSSGVHVAVYELSASDKQLLDRIEGVGKGYTDVTIDVPGFGRCATYIAAESYVDETLVPYDWYREMVLLGCRELALPQDYVARIERVAARPDPEPQRQAENWRIVERLRESRGRTG